MGLNAALRNNAGYEPYMAFVLAPPAASRQEMSGYGVVSPEKCVGVYARVTHGFAKTRTFTPR